MAGEDTKLESDLETARKAAMEPRPDGRGKRGTVFAPSVWRVCRNGAPA